MDKVKRLILANSRGSGFEVGAPGLLEPFVSQIWISVRGWRLLLRGLRFGDRGPLMGWQRQ